MSRTRRKMIREGICTGTNTSFYRDRRHRQRRINNQRLREAVNTNDIEDLDDVEYLEIPKEDSWMEPTDGRIIVDNNNLSEYEHIPRLYKKYRNTLKSKHRR